MPRKIYPEPDDCVKDWVIVKDGLLYWNKELATDKRQRGDKPIRGFNSPRPTVNIEGRTYDLSRLNYYMHTGDWPECVICKDKNKSNWHIDNLMPATQQQSNYHRSFKYRSYSIVERISPRGKRRYYAYFGINSKKKTVGGFKTESEALAAAITVRQLLHGEYMSQDIDKVSFQTH